MVPIYLKYMDISDYGAWLASGSVLAMIGMVEAGFGGIITQKMAWALSSSDSELFRKYTGSNLAMAILLFFILSITSIILAPYIPLWVNCRLETYSHLKMAVILSGLATSISLATSLIGVFPQVWQDTFYPGLFNTVSIFVGIGAIVFGLINGLHVASIGLGFLTRSILGFVLLGGFAYLGWKKRKYGKVLFSAENFVALLQTSAVPLMAKISNTVMSSTQNLVISYYISPSAAAVYDITGKIIITLRILITNIYGSVFGGLSLLFAQADNNAIIKNYLRLDFLHFSLLYLFSTFSVAFSFKVIEFWVGSHLFGGIFLLLSIVLMVVLTEKKVLGNTIVNTMGLIKEAAVLDISNAFIYIITMIVLLWFGIGIYSIPLSGVVSSIPFILLYRKLISVKFAIHEEKILYKWTITIVGFGQGILFHFILLKLDSLILLIMAGSFCIISVLIFYYIMSKKLLNEYFNLDIIKKLKQKLT